MKRRSALQVPFKGARCQKAFLTKTQQKGRKCVEGDWWTQRKASLNVDVYGTVRTSLSINIFTSIASECNAAMSHNCVQTIIGRLVRKLGHHSRSRLNYSREHGNNSIATQQPLNSHSIATVKNQYFVRVGISAIMLLLKKENISSIGLRAMCKVFVNLQWLLSGY